MWTILLLMCKCSNPVLVGRGVWNVPYVSSVYLMKASLLRSELADYDLFNSDSLDPDMAYCHRIRSKVGERSRVS